jgi:hypothetical protein
MLRGLMLAVWTRLELATPCVTGMYSNQLNYQTYCVLVSNAGANIRGFRNYTSGA